MLNSKNKSLTRVFGESDIVKVSGESNKDVIKFNHQLHASKDVGLVCKDCHGAAYESGRVTDNLNPNHDNCVACDNVNDDKECKLCHYDGVITTLKFFSILATRFFYIIVTINRIFIGRQSSQICTDLNKPHVS